MKTIDVRRDYYQYDTISKTNSKAWEILLNCLEESENKDEDLLFDFKGIEIIEPWINDTFKKLISNERVHMKLYSSKKTVDTINMACRLSNLKADRFYNEEVITPPTMTPAEKRIINMANELQDYFISSEDTALFEIHRRFTQIGSIDTVTYIEKAVEIYAENTNIKKIILDIKNILLQSNLIELVANVIGRLYTKGIDFKVVSEDSDTMNKLGLYQHLANNIFLSTADKYKIAKNNLEPGTVGMLTKYKRSKALDEFGRQGNGEPVSCRVALFNGFVKDKGVLCLSFTSYNGNTFYTKDHWSLENDGEELEELLKEELLIPIPEVGVTDYYLGSRYHFMLPLQCSLEDSTVIYGIEDGRVYHNKVTIPVRIKTVLDDWGIEYQESSLIHAISETERILEKTENSMDQLNK